MWVRFCKSSSRWWMWLTSYVLVLCIWRSEDCHGYTAVFVLACQYVFVSSHSHLHHPWFLIILSESRNLICLFVSLLIDFCWCFEFFLLLDGKRVRFSVHLGRHVTLTWTWMGTMYMYVYDGGCWPSFLCTAEAPPPGVGIPWLGRARGSFICIAENSFGM